MLKEVYVFKTKLKKWKCRCIGPILSNTLEKQSTYNRHHLIRGLASPVYSNYLCFMEQWKEGSQVEDALVS